MPIAFWNPALSVNIDTIDDQHKKLILMINDFYENIVNRSNQENISKLINSMKEYVLVHFKLEEDYMKKFEYDYYREHKKEHDKFVEKINNMEEKYNRGEMVLSLDVTSFLMNWLKNHIQVSDKKYSEFFIRKGVE